MHRVYTETQAIFRDENFIIRFFTQDGAFSFGQTFECPHLDSVRVSERKLRQIKPNYLHPIRLQGARHQPVPRLDRVVLPGGPGRPHTRPAPPSG